MFKSIICLGSTILSLVAITVASPIHLSRREISSDLLERFHAYSQFAAVSSCDQNINRTGRKLTCDFGTCQFVESANTITVDTFHNDTGPTGYIALDHTRQQIVLAFRGTVSQNDGATDLNVELVPINDVCDGCFAHSGFWNYWSDVADQVASQLKKTTASYPDYSLNVVGHSLGGALATLAGTVLREKGFALDIWTFGAPKVGNYPLAKFITDQKSPNSIYRATHASDPVPQVPIYIPPLFDWSQPSPEYWINQPTGEQVTTSVVEYIQGINNQTGNAGTGILLEWPNPNHGWYFGNMTVCVTSKDA